MSLFEINNYHVNNSSSEKEEVTYFQRYELLIKARNFHYENYNKWMSYFYVIISALFVAYYTVATASIDASKSIYIHEKSIYKFGILVLGIILSFFWFLANKGYYYWHINFITLINHYEKNILKFREEERIYFVFANKKNQDKPNSPLEGANFSTSKISIFISYIFTYIWCLILNYEISLIICKCENLCVYICIFLLPIFYILILTMIFSKCFKSSHKHFPDLKIELLDSNCYSSEKRYTT
ncbi:RipA family octameric membrane protein [Riemerella anatipestifer]|uniref:RipA family octameric membrane protein n=1 Tax=Riemerella anatipestifer TaxID=34085 RepID=UPI003DA9F6FF